MGELAFSPLSVPYLAAAIALAALGVVTVVVRGDTLIRLAMLLLVAVTLPWALSYALVGSTRDPALAERLFRVGLAPVSMTGPGLMLLVLAVSGRVDAHRWLLAGAFGVALTTAVLCWATELMVGGTFETASGLLFVTPGPLQLIHVLQIPAWGAVGVALSRRAMSFDRNHAWRIQRRQVVIIVGLSLVTLVDPLLAAGIGWYPAAWLPAVVSSGIGIYAILRQDLFRARGVDHASVLELAILAGVTGLLYLVLWEGNRTWTDRPLAAAVFTAPLPMIGLVASWTMRIKRRRAERASDGATAAIDTFAEEVEALSDEREVAVRLGELLVAHTQATDARVWLADDAGAMIPVVPVETTAPPIPIDARVRAWIVANPDPLMVAELATLRLGGLRALVEAMVARVEADVLVPLVDRDTLVGMAAGNLPRFKVLRDDERDFVRAVATTAARGMTFVGLTREAGHLAETAREVEVAEAVQQARAVGDTVIEASPWQVLAHYRPAARVAGDVWMTARLTEGRQLLFIGDVVGTGVPAALVSAAIGGVCEATASLRGAALEPRALLELVHKTVRGIGGGAQRVAAFAAVIDAGTRKVTFACAGHRGAYVVRPGAGEERVRLDVLHARGSTLGEPQAQIGEGERPMSDADIVVACSDGVVEVRDGRGEPWGERRLQRMMRDQVVSAGDRAARMIVAAAVAHAADAPVMDDMLAVVVRPVLV